MSQKFQKLDTSKIRYLAMSQVPISVEQHSTEAMASSEKEHWIDEPLDEIRIAQEELSFILQIRRK